MKLAHRTGSYATAGLALAAVAALSACGPQSQGGQAAPAGTSSGGGTPSATTAAPTVTDSGPAGTLTPRQTPSGSQAPAGPGRCHTSDLRLSLGGEDAGAGQRYATITLTNTSAGTCVVFGYGGVQLLDAAHHPLPTKQVRTPSPAPKTVTLKPGAGAHSTLHWGVVPDGTEPSTGQCEPSAAFLRVIPPDETTPLTVGFPPGPACEHGRLDQTAYAAA